MKQPANEKLRGKRAEGNDGKRRGLAREARKLGFNSGEIERLRQLYDARHRAR